MTTAIIIIGALAALVTLLHFKNAGDLYVEHKVNIQQPKEKVFEYLRMVKNQDHFSVWNMSDPGMKKTYRGTDGQIGFVYAWDSTNKNTGAGEQELKSLVPGQHITFELRFTRPMRSVAEGKFETSSSQPGSTEVTWSFRGPSKFPLTLMKPMMKKMLGKDMQQSLNNLQRIMQS